MEREGIKKCILYLLQDGLGHTFLEIREFLNINSVEGYSDENKGSLEQLKNLFSEMEDNGLIEERHFNDGRADYAIRQDGIDLIRKKRKKLKREWVLG